MGWGVRGEENEERCDATKGKKGKVRLMLSFTPQTQRSAMAATTATPTGTVSSRKLVLLGESAVGKSSLALRFCRNVFDDYRESTIGAAFLTQTLQLGPNTLKYELWDTAGQERYKSLAPMYYRNAHAAVVVYDLTSQASLLKAKAWIAELARQADPGIVICLAGNKLDLAPTQRQVSLEEAQKYAEEEGLLWIECSAKSGEGVDQLFLSIGAFSHHAPALRLIPSLTYDVLIRHAQRTNYNWTLPLPLLERNRELDDRLEDWILVEEPRPALPTEHALARHSHLLLPSFDDSTPSHPPPLFFFHRSLSLPFPSLPAEK